MANGNSLKVDICIEDLIHELYRQLARDIEKLNGVKVEKVEYSWLGPADSKKRFLAETKITSSVKH